MVIRVYLWVRGFKGGAAMQPRGLKGKLTIILFAAMRGRGAMTLKLRNSHFLLKSIKNQNKVTIKQATVLQKQAK